MAGNLGKAFVVLSDNWEKYNDFCRSLAVVVKQCGRSKVTVPLLLCPFLIPTINFKWFVFMSGNFFMSL